MSGRRSCAQLRGPELGLIFQEPMTRLDPLMPIEDHFRETLKHARARAGQGRDAARARSRPWRDGHPADALQAVPARVLRRHAPADHDRARAGPRPSLLIADEPTTALDVIVEAQILGILADLRRNFDTALLLITHNLGIVAEACDRVAVMYAGQDRRGGRRARVFSEPPIPTRASCCARRSRCGPPGSTTSRARRRT